jgi:O-antigen ligase
MVFLLALGILAAGVWAAVFLRWSGLLGGCLAVLIAGVCFGHAFFNIDVGPVPVTADRILLGLLVLTFFFQRQLGLTRRESFDWGDIAFIAFMGVLALSTFMHDWREDDFHSLRRLLFFFVLPFAMYWTARGAKMSPSAIRAAFVTFAVLGLYLAITGIAEKFGFWGIVFPRYVASPDYWEFYGRARGPLLNPVANGVLLCLGMCSSLVLWPGLKRRGQLLVVGALPIYAAGIFCTMTRSVWLGALVAVCVLIGLALPRNWRYASFAALILVGGMTVAGKWENMQSFKRDKFVSVVDMQRSASLRPILATIAWRMFCERPVFGCGLGRYREACPAQLSDRSSELPLQAARGFVQHNVFLALLTETGIAGAGLFVLLCTYWAWNAWSLWRGQRTDVAKRQWGLLALAILAVFLVNGMFHDVSITPMMNMLVFFMAGVTRGARAATVASALPDHTRSLVNALRVASAVD